ncbi:MAG TPA: type II toxin-antitoxin system HigB family toxin [Blastocatellia bacterium]|nr:type II toxin-antitoxin system HigB family toxin [Blastocatellia bacterium]
MHVISRKRLKEFWQKHPDAEAPLKRWHEAASKATWRNLAEVRLSFPHADPVGSCMVFNIKGNVYRLIVKIVYRLQRIYVRRVLAHAEYDKGEWKNECSG